MTISWLETPPSATWPTAEGEEEADPMAGATAEAGAGGNPFIRYRKLLWSWHRWTSSGRSDTSFVEMVRVLDKQVEKVASVGFVETPAHWDDKLATDSASGQVFVKDETNNVSGTHKARHLMGLLLHLAADAVASDVRLAIASCGNAALGAATVARAAGRPIDVFIPTWADPKVVGALEALDATIHVCHRQSNELGDPTMLAFSQAVADRALPFGAQATENIMTLDGGRTIGWELADQLGPDGVDYLFVQVGGGALLTSCAIGLLEGARLGALGRVPRVWAVQSDGCAPFDRAWQQLPAASTVDERLALAEEEGETLMTPWPNPTSAATGILDDMTYDWLGVAKALLLTGGSSIVVAETDIEAANQAVVQAGYNADHTGSAGLAGLYAATRRGLIPPSSTSSILLTGTLR